jgi:hypothetical protein
LLWALAFGFFEVAYFTRANDILPLSFGHILLALLFALGYFAVALVGALVLMLILRGRGNLGRAAGLLAGPSFMLLVLAVSHYRDRIQTPHPASTAGLVVTGLIFAAALLFFVFVSRSASRKPSVYSRLFNFAGVLLLCVGIVWLATSHSSSAVPTAQAADMERVQIADTGLRVLLIGFDGGTWSMFDPLLRDGDLPTFHKLISQGVTANVETIIPTLSPIIWTSVASGKVYEKHGIYDVVRTEMPLGLPKARCAPLRMLYLTKLMKYAIRLADRIEVFDMELYSSNDVRVQRLWDILADLGFRSVVIEWYTSHPVRPLDGVQVSDRFHNITRISGDVSGFVYPDTLQPLFREAVVPPEEISDQRLMSLLDSRDLNSETFQQVVDIRPVFYDLGRRTIARDLTTIALTRLACREVPDWRLNATYFRAVDTFGHVAWDDMRRPSDNLEDHPRRRLRPVVENYYRQWDSMLEEVLELADEKTVIILLSDHGFEDYYAHSRAPKGFLVMSGGPTRTLTDRFEISIYDIAPTVLALLGVPVPEDMDGRVLKEMVDPAFWASYPVQTVATYEQGTEREELSASTEVDEELVDQLRALGYIR